jgi:hypothetical protein
MATTNLSGIPILRVPGTSVPREPELHLTTVQAHAANDLFHGCVEKGAKLADGSPVKSVGDAIGWLLEQIDSAP